MDIVAAFWWNGSNDKSISHMIIDENYQVRSLPVIVKLHKHDMELFKQEANTAIEHFFSKIEHICQGNQNCRVKIEYKIVGHGSAAHLYHTQTHKPSDRTEYVREIFFEKFNGLKSDLLTLADSQLRKKLENSALKEFKEGLVSLQLIEMAYQAHLWAIALHATQSTYKSKLKKLTKALLPVQEIKTSTKKRRSA